MRLPRLGLGVLVGPSTGEIGRVFHVLAVERDDFAGRVQKNPIVAEGAALDGALLGTGRRFA